MSNKPWCCRLDMHQFVPVWNEDNQRYGAAAGAARTTRGARVALWTALPTSVALGSSPSGRRLVVVDCVSRA